MLNRVLQVLVMCKLVMYFVSLYLEVAVSYPKRRKIIMSGSSRATTLSVARWFAARSPDTPVLTISADFPCFAIPSCTR